MSTPSFAAGPSTSFIDPVLDGGGNDAYAWDQFDPKQYVADNYLHPFRDDLIILQRVRDFFVEIGPVGGIGIDVGPGANLYPTLAMLPFCDEIELHEWSRSNREWLNTQVEHFSELWEPYWHQLAPKDPIYRDISPREAVAKMATVKMGNIFQLPRRRWNLGVMFYVAESITTQKREFNLAIERFVGALRPGAPFAAAFMKESRGYLNGGIRFPAVPVTEADVRHALERHVDAVDVQTIFSGELLRSDYRGMILALGRAGKAKR
ncbi:SCO2525 family SAM-dependent methyltransferase [Dactylosporangium sp. NPDC051541]|uniref:SCO2525 family SAM-dependent methyltransferase n=1 Tax=Dactylosporangium sp. NPDC051541 TaxID=3363977 RepID=UPI003790169F